MFHRPIDQYLKFKNHCSLINPPPPSLQNVSPLKSLHVPGHKMLLVGTSCVRTLRVFGVELTLNGLFHYQNTLLGTLILFCSKILSPWQRRYSCRTGPPGYIWLAGRYENPMPESTMSISPSQGLRMWLLILFPYDFCIIRGENSYAAKSPEYSSASLAKKIRPLEKKIRPQINFNEMDPIRIEFFLPYYMLVSLK